MLRSIGVVALLLGAASTARAQDPSAAQIREGQAHFERGTVAFERGDYGEAAAEFEAAHGLTQHADLLYNVYSAQERNGELEIAATALEGYLRDGSPEASRREALELRLERLRSRIAEQRAVAAQEAARQERELLDADNRVREEQREREAAEQRAADERAGRIEHVRSATETADTLTLVGIVALVTAGAGLVSFGIFAGLSEAEDQSLASSCGRDAGMYCRDGDLETLRAFNTAADASWIGGAALGVTGGALLLIAIGLRPADVEMAWLAPSLGPEHAGLRAGGRW